MPIFVPLSSFAFKFINITFCCKNVCKDINFVCAQYAPSNKIVSLYKKQQKKIYKFLAHAGFFKCYLKLKKESFLNKNIDFGGIICFSYN